MKKTGKRILGLLLAMLMLVGLAVPTGMMAPTARAAAGDKPAHEKKVIDNGDGTYTIALNVTGDSEKKVNKTNVIMILDASNSMYVNNAPGTSNTRMAATLDAMEGVAQDLLAYNAVEGNPTDTVEVALIAFAPNATIAVQPTTSFDTFKGTSGGTEANCAEYYRNDHNYHGTNWQAALEAVSNVSFGTDDTDPTYVIFFTDGQPTRYVDQGSPNDFTHVQESYEAARNPAKKIVDQPSDGYGYTLYSIFAFGDTDGNFDAASALLKQLTNYAYNNGEVTDDSDYFFSASDTTELQAAFDKILSDIKLAGIGSVEIDDGTTAAVETPYGGGLLNVDEKSFKYYRAGGAYSETANGGLGEEWADAPKAELKDGNVKWDMKDAGVLENGVTYTVTFDVWPSQDTLDLIADIQNDPSYYDTLSADIQKYLDKDGKLKTNTGATLKYTDTRTGATGEEKFEDPDPVASESVEQLAVSKKWENDIDERKKEPVKLDVTRDGKPAYSVELSDSNSWTAKVFISTGIMRTKADKTMEVLAAGHDFTFTEPKDLSYHWEIDVPVVRPMLIDNKMKLLVLIDEKHEAPDAATVYEDLFGDGKNYYVSEVSSDGAYSLTAINYRRSSVNLIKVVDGVDIPEDAEFPFTLNIVNSMAPEKEPTDDKNHDSDWWVWISVRDMSETDNPDDAPPITGAVVSGAEDAGGGWYYGVSGQDIVLNVKNGYSIRLNNLPSESTYTITEGDLSKVPGFSFVSAEIVVREGEGTFEDFDTAGQAAYGVIESTNTLYQVTFTNKYALIDINVDKVWDDADDQDGIRPDELELTLNGAPEGTDIPDPEIEKDGNTWTYTWKGMPRYDLSGAEIAYTVTEDNVPDGYEKSGSPAKDGGTITNTHKTENISVTVTKVWEDNDDQDGKRPDKLDLTLNGVPEGVNTPDPEIKKDGNTWTYTWSGLPEKNNGETIKYTVTETAVPEGYTCGKNEVDAGGTITNTHTAETVDVTVTKVWDDEDDKDSMRPDSLELTLEGLPEGVKAPEPKVTKDGSKWTYTWSGMPKYSAGKEIKYTVTEDEVPEGYECEESTAEAGGTITNTHTVSGERDLTVQKVWVDSNDKDKLRPDSINVNLMLNGEKYETQTLDASNNWAHTWEKVPMDKDHVYTIEEDAVPKGYTSKISGSVNSGLITITNTHETTPEYNFIRIEIVKVWEDDSDAAGIRTENVQVMLLKGGVTNLTRTLGDSNEWKYEGYVEAGYNYKVVETPVDGYESIVTQSPIPGGIRFTVTNKLTKTPELNTEDHVAYIVGYPDGTVRPGKEITRAEVATIFFRLLTDEARDKYWSQTNPYPDVAPDAWYNNAISTLTKMGIINGYEDGTFRPNNPITRAELTKMAVCFFTSADQYFGRTPSFSDVPANAWYTRFIAAAEELGLINGYPDGTFRPANNITRAETCTIVNRTLGRVPHKDHLLPYEEMINWPDNTPDAWYYAQIQEASNSHDYDWITEQIENTTVEDWTAKLPERDWVALEQVWSTSHSAPGGEVMG